MIFWSLFIGTAEISADSSGSPQVQRDKSAWVFIPALPGFIAMVLGSTDPLMCHSGTAQQIPAALVLILPEMEHCSGF